MDRLDELQQVLASAARLQRLVSDAVLVGGTAAALHAQHRLSFGHDHVLTDLADRYADIVAAVEASEGWVTSVRASSPPLTLMGSLDGVEAGLRQLRRTRPLEVEEHAVPGGNTVRAPTLEEMLRVKAYLVVQRNAVRDYLDTVALTARLGQQESVRVLAAIDDFYADRSGEGDAALTTLTTRLSEPSPRDVRVTRQLSAYKGLDQRWQRWDAVVAACQQLADSLLDAQGG